MIPNTPFHYIFIRLSIWGVRAVTPVAVLYSALYILGYTFLPLPVEIWAFAETAFYFFASVPRQIFLDKEKPIATTRTRQERRELFNKCLENLPNLETFLCTYFKGQSLDSLHREDVKDFWAWGFLYKTHGDYEDEEELEEYLALTEKSLNMKFKQGRGPHRPSQVSTDRLNVMHKPLVFYIIAVGGDDIMTYIIARWYGLQHYRLSLFESWKVFPFRPHTALTAHISPSKHVSYWYQPHTSNDRLPVLFLHGVGAGLRTYIDYLGDFIKNDAAMDGQTGVIALELMPISMRMTRGQMAKDEMVNEVVKILDHHKWDRFTIVSHSYGTIIASHVLKRLEDRVGPMLLVDPVAISIHWGEIPHNFLYRKPRKASEWQLQYFASCDIGISHTLTRRFDWSENVLWKQDLHGRNATIVISGKDIIVEPYGLLKYLQEDTELKAKVYNSKNYPKEHDGLGGKGLRVLWYDHANHAEMFDIKNDRKPLVDITNRYCGMVV